MACSTFTNLGRGAPETGHSHRATYEAVPAETGATIATGAGPHALVNANAIRGINLRIQACIASQMPRNYLENMRLFKKKASNF